VRRKSASKPSTHPLAGASRALDQELEWYFVYAETALRRGCVQLVPGHLGASLAASQPTEDALLTKAHAVALTVQGCLRALPDRHVSVLRAAYTPRRWPRNVEATFESLAPIVVRLAVAKSPWPHKSGHAGLEEAAAVRLSGQLAAAKPLAMAKLKVQAGKLFGEAVVAYRHVRVLEAPGLHGD
jgi:hypothetical protein